MLKKLLFIVHCSLFIGLATVAQTPPVEVSQSVVVIDGVRYHVHTVQPGQTIYSLTKAYGVSEQELLEANPQLADGLKYDQNIKIPVATTAPDRDEKGLSARQMRKTFDRHTVEQGETLYAIARRYEISVETLIGDNPAIDPLQLPIGTELLIRKKEIGKSDEQQIEEAWEEYNDHFEDFTTPDVLEEPAEEAVFVEMKYEIDFRPLMEGETLRVALLLPMTGANGRGNANYVHFYRGFLAGLEKAKTQYGHSVQVDLYDTMRDPVQVQAILEEQDFRAAQLIVGPVYENELAPVVAYAEQHEIPVVSPLADLKGTSSDVLFQMAPSAERQYTKLEELLSATNNLRVTLIYGASNDTEFEREVLAALGDVPHVRQQYSYGASTSNRAVQSLLTNGLDNRIFILSKNSTEVERILTALSSMNNNLTARGRTSQRFVVIGNPLWNRFTNIDRTLYFKNRVVFFSTYHAKRDAAVVRAFDRDYVRWFSMMPSLYSYRGYDAAMIFVPAMYADIQYDMQGRNYTPLQTTYTFEQTPERPTHTNQNWMRVTYNPNFTITTD